MNDQELIENMKGEREAPRFRSREWTYLLETDTRSYDSSPPRIKFDNSSSMNKFCIYNNAYISFNTILESVNTVWTDVSKKVFLKESCEALIDQLLVTIKNNIVVNSANLAHYNATVAMIESSKSVTPFEKEYFRSSGINEFKVGINGGVIGIVDQSVFRATEEAFLAIADYHTNGVDKRSNPQVVERLQQLYTYELLGGGNDFKYSVNFKIPLAMIHKFFSCLNFPIPNLHLQLNLALSQGVLSDEQPFATTFTTTVATSLPLAEASYPYWTVTERVRLNYEVIEFEKSEQDMVKNQISSGKWNRQTSFYDYVHQSLALTVANTKVQMLVNSGIKNPRRLIFAIEKPSSRNSPQELMFQVERVSNIRVKLDNQNFFDEPILTNEDAYEYLKGHLANDTLLDYNTWRNAHAVYAFDLTKNGNLYQVASSKNVQIELLFDRPTPNANPVVLHTWIEQEKYISLEMSSGLVSVTEV